MADILAELSEVVGALSDQPVDALNIGQRIITGVDANGAPIVAHHVPTAFRGFPRRPPHVPQPASSPEREPVEHAQKPPPPETKAEPAPDLDVTIQLPAPTVLDQILRARAERVVVEAFPANPASVRFGMLVGPFLDMEEWSEWYEQNAAIERFFDYATAPSPDPALAAEYAGGRIGAVVCVPVHLVTERARESWGVMRIITATHSGSLKLLSTLDAHTPVGAKFAAWLRMLVCEYRLWLRYVPDPCTAERTWYDEGPDTLGHIEVYYTAMTLAQLYGLTAEVRASGKKCVVVDESAPVLERARGIVDQYVDVNQKTFVFSMDGPDARRDPPPAECVSEDMSRWHSVLTAELPFSCAYEDDVRVTYCMWTQAHSGAPGAVYMGLSMPHDTTAIDAHFTVHMRSRYHPHRELPLTLPLPSMPLAKAVEPVRAPMAPFAVEFEAASLEGGTSVARYTVEETALMDITYRFAAPAWVSVSYTIPHADASVPTKYTQFADLRLHVAEPVLAVFMAQALARMADDREAELHADALDTDPDHRALITRAMLFHNVCE